MQWRGRIPQRPIRGTAADCDRAQGVGRRLVPPNARRSIGEANRLPSKSSVHRHHVFCCALTWLSLLLASSVTAAQSDAHAELVVTVVDETRGIIRWAMVTLTADIGYKST